MPKINPSRILGFILVAVPIGILGAILLTTFKDFEGILRGSYAVLMFILSYQLICHHDPRRVRPLGQKHGVASEPADRPTLTITCRDGRTYSYKQPRQRQGAIVTGIGGFFTGLLGVGIGEVVMTQLAKHNGVPIPVAAATSVFVVVVVCATASFTQISTLVAQGGLNALPWNVVIYTIPAVIIGGQIGPRLQGLVSQRTMERAIGSLFLLIGMAMGYMALSSPFLV